MSGAAAGFTFDGRGVGVALPLAACAGVSLDIKENTSRERAKNDAVRVNAKRARMFISLFSANAYFTMKLRPAGNGSFEVAGRPTFVVS